MNVLIVDDHPTNRKLLAAQLQGAGHAVIEAEDGVAALEALQRQPVDALIADVFMPRMDGYRLCLHVREALGLDLPIVFFTAASVSDIDRQLGLRLGADLFVGKPAPAEAIDAALREACAQRAARTPASTGSRADASATTLAFDALAEARQRLALATESAGIGIWDWDVAADRLVWDAQMYALYGIRAEDFGGAYDAWQRGVHPDDRARAGAECAAALAGTRAFDSEFRVVWPGGEVRHIEAHGRVLRGADGAPLRMIGVNWDVTPRKRSEESLKSIEWMLTRSPAAAAPPPPVPPYGDLRALNTERTILDAVGPELLGDIVDDYMSLLGTSSAVYEKNGDYAHGIFTSGWCQAMDGASFRQCGTADARRALDCGRWHCHESCWNEASRPSMATHGPVDIECRGGIRLYAVPIRAGDEIVGSINFGYGEPPREPARLAALAREYGVDAAELERQAAAYRPRPPFIIELAKRRLQGSARLIGEIVQRKRAQDALNRANATLEQRVAARTTELEQAVKELETFAYSVAHDLRAPLRAIDGFSRILAADHAAALPAESREYLQLIRGAVGQMDELIRDLLAFARLSRQELRREIVLPDVQVRECLELLRAERNGRAIELAVGALPACEGDAGLLRLVWLNLLSNALKFTRRTAVARIEVGCVDAAGEPTWFVRDNGVGFNMAYADKLFGVFQRLHRSEDYEGTGVGLATAQRIVQRHGGRIWAEAALNRGATFFFTLPRGATP
jgi:PAS domain S-box-containing protein